MFKVSAGDLPGLLTLEPAIHRDERGFFLETYNQRDFEQATGIAAVFVQQNQSHSHRSVLRGLHYQVERPQAKLVRVLSGEIYDVAVDVRKHSPTLGRWQGRTLSARDGTMLWIPGGYAHGFLVLSETADVEYKTTDYWYPEHERSIAWNDPDLGITWPIAGAAFLSEKDRRAHAFRDAELIE
jgi:dTDP-4-dehydrorhamnose 3,5-epimerase